MKKEKIKKYLIFLAKLLTVFALSLIFDFIIRLLFNEFKSIFIKFYIPHFITIFFISILFRKNNILWGILSSLSLFFIYDVLLVIFVFSPHPNVLYSSSLLCDVTKSLFLKILLGLLTGLLAMFIRKRLIILENKLAKLAKGKSGKKWDSHLF